MSKNNKKIAKPAARTLETIEDKDLRQVAGGTDYSLTLSSSTLLTSSVYIMPSWGPYGAC
jgi:hypothetical protein